MNRLDSYGFTVGFAVGVTGADGTHQVDSITCSSMLFELTPDGHQALVAALSRLDETVDDAGRIGQLSALERVKSAVAAGSGS